MSLDRPALVAVDVAWATTPAWRGAGVSVDHRVMGGVPCIRGTRIPVATVVAMVAEGLSNDEILADFPQLDPEDIRAALQLAAAAVDERELPLRSAG